MREIKFRAWDDGKRKMITPYYYLKNDTINLTNKWAYIARTEYANHPANDHFYATNIMQYTGLKDKNGKEIYEGDWVKNAYGTIWKIKWSESYENEPCWNIASDRMVEVIGNIYENPEL